MQTGGAFHIILEGNRKKAAERAMSCQPPSDDFTTSGGKKPKGKGRTVVIASLNEATYTGDLSCMFP